LKGPILQWRQWAKLVGLLDTDNATGTSWQRGQKRSNEYFQSSRARKPSKHAQHACAEVTKTFEHPQNKSTRHVQIVRVRKDVRRQQHENCNAHVLQQTRATRHMHDAPGANFSSAVFS